ncbi:DUF5110 domain-containing protein [Streptomyces umbrinus]|uniref:DUF5110 domain-containing protein n=1 Tax=Streptomyces umbrinus TaxID=67370 RepID=UPI003C2EC5E9
MVRLLERSQAHRCGADLPHVTHTGETPLFVRAGAILPKYPYAQSTAHLNKQQLELEVYTGADGAFELVEDDSVTEAYRDAGATSVTALTYTDASTKTVISHPRGTYDCAPTSRRYLVRLHGLAERVGMRINGGATLPAFTSEAGAVTGGGGTVWDPDVKILTVVSPSIPTVVGGGVAATVEPSGTAFPVPTGGTVLQAEDAGLDGAVIDTRHREYTGAGYADFATSSVSAAFIEWTLPVTTAGPRGMVFRYANGSSLDRPLAVSVDGRTVGTLSFPPTGGWDAWTVTEVTTNLPGGDEVTVRAVATGSNGANIDSLTVTAVGRAPGDESLWREP